MKILHIDSSVLGEHSASRRLTTAVVKRLLEGNPDAFITYRDLARNGVPQFSGALANLASVPVEKRSSELQRDALELFAAVEEVLAADVIVVGAPMYNFGIPSQLKSWLDALAVPGKTFQYDATGVKGLLGAKRVVIASARGGFYGAETPMAALDHQETYLRSFFGFLGVTRMEVVRAEGLKVSDEMKDLGMAAGLRQAAELQVA
ncbi:FMN-dependent NADH-azoreductase [Variovorax sp. ZT5P49]|uniref:FMN-dependent NADH-azoreductase n=1 Tax=Variovorax sp. ZT5P49 TaxID=3443733 RepID=UPI003F480792